MKNMLFICSQRFVLDCLSSIVRPLFTSMIISLQICKIFHGYDVSAAYNELCHMLRLLSNILENSDNFLQPLIIMFPIMSDSC